MPDTLTPAEIAAARSAFNDPSPAPGVVASFQRRLGVTPDGIAGPVTWVALHALEADHSGDDRQAVSRLRISPRGLTFIQRYEGYRANWYRDAVGVLTIGFGHTGPLPSGVRPPLSREAATSLMEARIEREFAAGIRSRVTVPLYQHEFDALVSLAYNIGVGAFGRSSLLRSLNRGQYAAAARGFAPWCTAGGKVLKGLVRRRADETKMFTGS